MTEEMLPILDEQWQTIGTAPRSVCHNGESFLLHPVVHLHIVKDGKVLLQKRSINKKIQPGRWDTCVGGHVDANEDIRHALLREASEEIGFDATKAQLINRYVFKSSVEQELINVHIIKVEPTFEIAVTNDEVDEVKFWSIEEILAPENTELFTPNFLYEFNHVVRKNLGS